MPFKESLLVVDDTRASREATARILQRAGFRTVVADDGASGIAAAREYQVDGILLDVVMPDQSGIAVTRRIREDPALEDVAILLLSSMRVSPAEQALGLDAGADAYIIRPVDQ